MQEPPACSWAALSSTSGNSLKRPLKSGTGCFLHKHIENFWFVQVKTYVHSCTENHYDRRLGEQFQWDPSTGLCGTIPRLQIYLFLGKICFEKAFNYKFSTVLLDISAHQCHGCVTKRCKTHFFPGWNLEATKLFFNGASPNSLLLSAWIFCHHSFSLPLSFLFPSPFSKLPHLQSQSFLARSNGFLIFPQKWKCAIIMQSSCLLIPQNFRCTLQSVIFLCTFYCLELWAWNIRKR